MNASSTQCSLIITTYNWPEALNAVLASLLTQTVMPDEVIIADDGSGPETKELIHNWQDSLSTPLIHSWQEDLGFRASVSRNKAIAKAKYELIVILDGDLLLHPMFIADHKANSSKNSFIQGTRVMLGPELSQQIIYEPRRISPLSNGIQLNRKNAINNGILSRVFSKYTSSIHNVRSANMSFYKNDLVKINGFNEDIIGWGREDTELVVRLINSGVRRKNLKFAANAYHLHHIERSRKDLPKNDKILNDTISNNSKWCDNGIDKHL